MALDSFVDEAGQEQHAILFEISFLEEKLEDAFVALTELLARPNYYDFQNLSELIRELSVHKANNIGQEGLRYGLSYGGGLLGSWAARFEDLQNDVFICQLGAEVIKTTDPKPIYNDVAASLYEISRRVFSEENLDFAVHGDASKFAKVHANLEIFLRTLEQENLGKWV